MDVAWARLGLVSLLSVSTLAACAKSTSTAVETFPKTTAECRGTAVPNRYLVRWKDGSTSIHESVSREELLRDLVEPNLEEIEFAEQDQVVTLNEPLDEDDGEIQSQAAVPQSPEWGQQITEASNAWSRGYNGQGVIVAVIDSGVDVNHPQLRDQLAFNTGEIPGDGVDNDGNGLVDDYKGYDFNLRSGNITDGTGHGTHVAGVIAAKHSAGTVKGVAQQARILPLDFMNDEGSGNISDAIAAMYYAASRGAKIVNASWGGAPCSKSLQKAIADLGAQGVLFVSAAGNAGVDIGVYPEYPAAYAMDTQITVGWSTPSDYMHGESNYSYSLVQLTAPGSQIYSTYLGNGYKTLSGTSMATPFVSAAAAVLWSARPGATLQEVKESIIGSVDAGPFEVSTRGRLNIRKAIDLVL